MAIIITDSNVLKKISTPASLEESMVIVKELENTLRMQETGVGLSAIQIGIPKRIFVIKGDQDREQEEFDHFINPEIIEVEDEFTFEGEGCLSFPGLYLCTKRFHHYTLKRGHFDNGEYLEEQDYFYYPETDNEYISHKEAIRSIAAQHEMDHLDGKILPDFGFEKSKIIKVGRNDPCPCGKIQDGKPVKYKKCCGKS